MTLEVVFRPTARGDLFGLYNYIADQSGMARAAGYLDRVRSACAKLGDFPEQGRRRDDIESGVRTIGFERRVLIIYRIGDVNIEILRVLYAGRELPEGKPDW